MSTGSNGPADNSGTPKASDTFRDLIEERYLEWEREFGEEVRQRRKIDLNPKP